jgi:hypothetical protein
VEKSITFSRSACLAERRDHQVDLAGLQIRDAVRAVDGHEFELDVHRLREQRGRVDVVALRLHVGAD